MKCECCEQEKPDVVPRPAMTAYHWDGEGEDPNRDVFLCDEDWEEYRAYWQERWDEYYSMVL
jgi:hypothetical protein